MLAIWDKWGVRYPVTVLQLDQCQVVQVKTEEENGYTALQLGVGEAKVKRVNKPLLGHFKAQLGADGSEDIHVSRKLMEFKVTPDCVLPVGTQIYATHFVPGQLIDVCGVSKGKGFQGVMKRHNFKGGRASHGNSLNHRTPGSTGQRQDPGKVFKGKKMPGNMGNDRVTVQNLHVLKIDVTRNLLYVKGAVPGQKGAFLRVQDAVKGPFYPDATVSPDSSFKISPHPYNPYTLPMPTMFKEQYEDLVSTLVAEIHAKREKDAADAVLGKSKKQLRNMRLQAEAETAATLEANGGVMPEVEEAPLVISLWANTAGVTRSTGQANNVEVTTSTVEIDPMKGVDVTDAYAL
jgi:large subunit ribosomal protein L3